MTKREQGRKAVETMLRYGVPTIEINGILAELPAVPFANGAYERLIEEQIAESDRVKDGAQ